jgi:hypothetical protein
LRELDSPALPQCQGGRRTDLLLARLALDRATPVDLSEAAPLNARNWHGSSCVVQRTEAADERQEDLGGIIDPRDNV